MDPVSTIGRVGALTGSGGTPALTDVTGTGIASFGKSLEDALANLSRGQDASQTMAREFQSGNPDISLEETMIAMQQSSLSFQAAVQVRNKFVSAYNEIMNMQV